MTPKKHTTIFLLVILCWIMSFSKAIQANSEDEILHERSAEKQIQKKSLTPLDRAVPVLKPVPAAQQKSPNDIQQTAPISGMALQPKIIVTTPGNGQEWRIDEAHKVSWNKIGNMGSNVSIHLVRAGANMPILTVVMLTPNSGNYTIPAGFFKNLAFDDYILRIETTDHAVVGNSPAFKLTPPPLSIPQMSASSSEHYRYCPDSLMLDNIPTEPPSFDGFIGVPVANIPAKFTFSGVGRSSPTECYCQYQLGELKARIRADMTGYTSCTAGFIPKPGTNSQVKGLILNK